MKKKPSSHGSSSSPPNNNNYSDKIVLKCQDRDLTVLIGPDEKPYLYYSTFLAAKSDFIDTMLSHEMKEKKEMVIRFPDISVRSWELLEKYLYPDGELKYAYHTCDDAMALIPLAVRFGAANLISECDKTVSYGGKSLRELASILCAYESSLPYTKGYLNICLKKGDYNLKDIKPSTLDKLLEYSDLNQGIVCKIFSEYGYIPPMYRDMKVEDIIRDREKMTTMMYYKKLNPQKFATDHDY